MYEVEMKFRIASPSDFERKLETFGVVLEPAVEEFDQFYRHPARDFAKTDEGLRIRRRVFADGSEERFLTYKGPKIDPLTKTRKEIEIPLEVDQPWHDVLTALDFQPAAVVVKTRRRGTLEENGRSFDIVLDQLPEFGFFTELETIASEADKDAARQALLVLAAKLGLDESIRMGYLEMLTNNPCGSRTSPSPSFFP